jgi:hypothetical protein
MCKLQLRLKKSQGKAETKPQIDIEALKSLKNLPSFHRRTGEEAGAAWRWKNRNRRKSKQAQQNNTKDYKSNCSGMDIREHTRNGKKQEIFEAKTTRVKQSRSRVP